MKIKIHPGKLATIAVMAFIYLMGLIATSLSDTLQPTRHQLTKLYETSFDNCVINKIDTLAYPTLRGMYTIFYTNCKGDFFPVLLDKDSDSEDYSAFKRNVRISKNKNSVDIELLDNGEHYKIKAKHPDDEDDRGTGVKVFLIFILIVTIVVLIAPNSKFDYLTNN